MDFKKLNEELEILLEGDVIDFSSFKNRKATTAVMEEPKEEPAVEPKSSVVKMTINNVTVIYCEGLTNLPNKFKDGEILSFEEMQKRIYFFDRLKTMCNLGGYEKLRYEADVTYTVNGKDVKGSYDGRIDLGDGAKDLDYVSIPANMIHFMSEEKGIEAVVTNPMPTIPTDLEEQVTKYIEENNLPTKEKQDAKRAAEEQERLSKIDFAKPVPEGKDPKDVEVGDVIYMVGGYSMIMPSFFRVIARTKASIKVEELKTATITNNYGSGTMKPISTVDSNSDKNGKIYRINNREDRYNKDAICYIDRHSACYWTGEEVRFDYND